MRVEVRVAECGAGMRLDAVISQAFPPVSRRVARAWILAGRATVDGSPQRRNARLSPGQLVCLEVPDAGGAPARWSGPQPGVRFEDDHLLIADKPAGMVVHPAYRHQGDTLFDALLARAAGPDGVARYRPGLVHRLDKDTSGLVLVTKTATARSAVQRLLDRGDVAKEYVALVRGSLDDEGAVALPLGRDPEDRTRALVAPGGRPARTRWRVRERLGPYSVVELRLETGRMHQIRAHLAAVGLPIVGDALYGGAALGSLSRQFLHARRLAFPHPVLRHPVEVVSPLPTDLATVLDRCREEATAAACSGAPP